MIELAPRAGDEGGGAFTLSFGGDTLNTAIYMARLGQQVDYLTALGDDGFSDRMLAAWSAEGIGTGHVARLKGRLPGLYLIETDGAGERRFHYWRQQAPARELFALPGTAELVAELARFDLIYLSGITLSLYGEAGREVLLDALVNARRHGARVAFDTNYRTRGWSSAAEARQAMAELLKLTDIALTGLDDEQALYGLTLAREAVHRLQASGIDEIVVKLGRRGAIVAGHDFMTEVAAETVGTPVDTTAAGDSFNAAYLVRRAGGATPEEAAAAGNRLAAEVIRHPGAIIPKGAMPALT
ncbi:MAG: sugar kinase [Alphaproteobacteria bacterium]|nr:sugar kinase [Alphaproteobacteria bacterium]